MEVKVILSTQHQCYFRALIFIYQYKYCHICSCLFQVISYLLCSILSLCLNLFHLLAQKPNLEFSIYSNKFFHNFHLSESIFNLLQASGLTWRLYTIPIAIIHLPSAAYHFSIFPRNFPIGPLVTSFHVRKLKSHTLLIFSSILISLSLWYLFSLTHSHVSDCFAYTTKVIVYIFRLQSCSIPLHGAGMVVIVDYNPVLYHYTGLAWSWSYGSLIYNYRCNQCLSPAHGEV